MTTIVRNCVPALAACLLFSACASSPKKIDAAYVSPLKYQNLNCDQVGLERTAIQYRANVLYHSLKKRARGDAVKMGVGAVLFLPTLFFIKGDGTKAAEFAQMKGDYQALQIAGQDRGCNLQFVPLEEAAAAKMATAELVVDPR